MAPERFDGHPADSRSDTFAFGVMFFEMISKRCAFDEKNPARRQHEVSASPGEVLRELPSDLIEAARSA